LWAARGGGPGTGRGRVRVRKKWQPEVEVLLGIAKICCLPLSFLFCAAAAMAAHSCVLFPAKTREFKAVGAKSNNQTQSHNSRNSKSNSKTTSNWGLFQPLKFRSYCQILVLPVMQIPGTT